MLAQNREMPPLAEIQDIPLQSYVRSKQLELAVSLGGKKSVYLDIKFWIILCDIVMGERIHRLQIVSASPRKLLVIFNRGGQLSHKQTETAHLYAILNTIRSYKSRSGGRRGS